MATVTRVNGSGLTVAGNVHSPGAFAFKILVKDTSAAAIDLRAEDDLTHLLNNIVKIFKIKKNAKKPTIGK